MASNPAYVPFTFVLAAALIALLGIGWAQRKKRLGRGVLIVSPLAAAFLLLYFWHIPFHDAARSVLAPSRSYSCELDGDGSRKQEPFTIPLPKRTVFKGKTNACSPFYRTYATADEFNRLYGSQLEDWKRSGAIAGWTRMEPEAAGDGSAWTSEGFDARLNDGRIVLIRMRTATGESGGRMIAIDIPATTGGLAR